MREFYPSVDGELLPSGSLVNLDNKAVHITSMEFQDGKLQIRLNDKGKQETEVKLSVGNKNKKIKIPANGIVTIGL